ncbi:MAG: ice-binding family protein [Tenericutes bacterium]|nr:ice-binding family protein [Mycoplasmatota bacterium]
MKTLKKIFNPKMMIFAILVTMIFLVTACGTNEEDPTEVIPTPTEVIPTEDIDVTSIELSAAGSATTISALGGTLQMSATVLPANATDPTFTWSVTNGTGSATITVAGLLTAETDGIVTVTATSNATTGVYGSKVITISNQLAANMDATLTHLEVDGSSVLGFNPLVTSYVHVMSDGIIVTPVVTATLYETTSTVLITDAVDVTSTDVLDRTTAITVTTTEDVEKVYYVIFETQAAPVDLGTAGDFVILAETGISTATTSDITGDLGVSPSAASYITGFSLIMDSSGTYSTSSQVVGMIYAADYTTPTPSKLTTAIADMMIAYSDAAGRANNYTELYSGDLSGKTLTPGVYKFGSSVLINTDLTLTGSATDVWIFQISGNLTMASDMSIILAGGADAKNIVWQVADTVAIGSGSHFEGTILAMTNISMGTNSSINGRLYAQTAVTLDATTVVKSSD